MRNARDRTVALLLLAAACGIALWVVGERSWLVACGLLAGTGSLLSWLLWTIARDDRALVLDELLVTAPSHAEAREHARELSKWPVRRSLNRTLRRLVRDAGRPAVHPALYDRRCVRSLSPDLLQLARVVADDRRQVPGEAIAVVRLLIAPSGPLVHHRPDERRARMLIDRAERMLDSRPQ